jgi:TDG/mug DNA glycosylase family protein
VLGGPRAGRVWPPAAAPGTDDAVSRVLCLPPIADARARVLVLGSMPGVASLRARQYYAHPRNAFWPIAGELFRFPADAPYARRVRSLRRCGIALWDVLASCARDGSLDGDIEEGSTEVNDFAAFFAAHPRIGAVFCNGGTSYANFCRRVLPPLTAAAAALPVVRLPSTSAAHASLRRPQKLARWRAVAIALERAGAAT